MKLTAWAKKTYAKLVDESSLGTIVVDVTNEGVDGGDVRVDNEPKGTISSGRLNVPNLSDGSHHLVIEVGGFQRFEKDVTVVPNERTPVSVTLTRDPTQPDWKTRSTTGSTSEGNNKNYWKGMFVGGTVLAAVGGAFWAYAYLEEQSKANNIHSAPEIDGVGQSINANLCKNQGKVMFPHQMTGDDDMGALNTTCDWRTRTGYGIAGLSVGAVVMIATFYSAFLKDSDDESSTNHRTTNRKQEAEVRESTPVISPDGGGAEPSPHRLVAAVVAAAVRFRTVAIRGSSIRWMSRPLC